MTIDHYYMGVVECVVLENGELADHQEVFICSKSRELGLNQLVPEGGGPAMESDKDIHQWIG